MENERYPMGESQPAQIDCRDQACRHYQGSGKCSNVAPAITLNENKTFVCWSWKQKPERKTEEQTSPADAGN